MYSWVWDINLKTNKEVLRLFLKSINDSPRIRSKSSLNAMKEMNSNGNISRRSWGSREGDSLYSWNSIKKILSTSPSNMKEMHRPESLQISNRIFSKNYPSKKRSFKIQRSPWNLTITATLKIGYGVNTTRKFPYPQSFIGLNNMASTTQSPKEPFMTERS